MTKRDRGLWAGASCALLAILLAALPSAAHAQSADLVLCDRVAADPSDPDKPASVKGVGEINPGDVSIAIKYCRTASGGSRRALYQLGRAYAANGQLSEAAGAYRKAADKGSSAAMVELGVMYGTGNGLQRDDAQARSLFERAAKAGNARGFTNLSAVGGAASDPVRMRAVLQKQADANSAEAQYQLGMMMADGTGGPKDDAAARALFEKAAAQDHPRALERAGYFAETGLGGPKDSTAAKAYYEKAALLGNEDAKAALKHVGCKFVLKDKRGNEFGCW